MIIVLKPQADEQKMQAMLDGFTKMGLSHNVSAGTQTTIVGIIGDTSKVDIDSVLANDIVEDVKRVSEPYKAANRKFHPDDTVITLPGGQKVKFWDDSRVYLGNQLCKHDGSGRCYGLTADEEHLLVCEYGDSGSDPEIVVYKRREK